MTSLDARRVCVLPGGYLDENGVLHREAELAPLTGHEEELLAETGGAVSTPELVTAILSRCVRRIGSIQPVDARVARGLLVADRQYLLLRLRAATFGDRVEGTLACPWPQCGSKVDVDFSLDDVPVKRREALEPAYRVELSRDDDAEGDGEHEPPRAATFRLPRGSDQEALAAVLAENPARALTALLERCIVGTEGGPEDVGEWVEGLTPRARREIEEAMLAASPHLDLEMELVCPECGRAFTAPFDLPDFFFGELRTSRDLLYRQVHYLAYHYHWSEREILGMTRDKRLSYIEILADEIEALNHAV